MQNISNRNEIWEENRWIEQVNRLFKELIQHVLWKDIVYGKTEYSIPRETRKRQWTNPIIKSKTRTIRITAFEHHTQVTIRNKFDRKPIDANQNQRFDDNSGSAKGRGHKRIHNRTVSDNSLIKR